MEADRSTYLVNRQGMLQPPHKVLTELKPVPAVVSVALPWEVKYLARLQSEVVNKQNLKRTFTERSSSNITQQNFNSDSKSLSGSPTVNSLSLCLLK